MMVEVVVEEEMMVNVVEEEIDLKVEVEVRMEIWTVRKWCSGQGDTEGGAHRKICGGS